MTKAYELLATPDEWTQGRYAIGPNGMSVDIRSDAAQCWCVDGALARCYGFSKQYSKAYMALDNRVGNPLVWNDAPERTHAEVVAVLRELDI